MRHDVKKGVRRVEVRCGAKSEARRNVSYEMRCEARCEMRREARYEMRCEARC